MATYDTSDYADRQHLYGSIGHFVAWCENELAYRVHTLRCTLTVLSNPHRITNEPVDIDLRFMQAECETCITFANPGKVFTENINKTREGQA
jgi:hypothetical protein